MKKILALILALTMVLVGCTSGAKEPEVSNGGTTDNGGKVEEAKPLQEEYRTIYSGEITTINYLVTSSTNEFGLAANFVDTLIDYDQYGVEKPGLATEWNVSEDGLVWTFKLREGVKWMTYDNKEYAEVTAQDFVDALKYSLNPANESKTANIAYGVLANAEAYYNGEITDFEKVGVKAVDKYTVQYTLAKPTPYFLSMVTYVSFFPANGQFLAEVGDRFGTDNTTILYNGAYIMETFEPQTRRILVANENYWDKENIFIKKITQTFNNEAATLAPELFARGEIDSASISSDIIDEWLKDPVKSEMVRSNRTGFYTYFYAFNFDPQFDEQYEPANWKIAVNNVNFRKSIFHGLDRKAAMLTQDPYNPEPKISNTITPKNFVEVDGLDYTQLGSLKTISETDSFDVAKALEYKEKAMSELSGKAKFPVIVYMPYNSGSSDWANRAQVIEQQLEKALGTDYIDVVIDAKPPTGFLAEVRRSGKYAFLEANWGPDYADPETYTGPFVKTGTYNWPHLAEGYADTNGEFIYHNMIATANAEALDMRTRYELFAEAEAYFINEAFVIPYGLSGGGYSASKLNPFESQYSPFGVSGERFKGQKILEKPMNTEEYNEALAKWEAERAEALKAAK